MFNVLGEINWIAVTLALLACTALGGVWFAALFPKQYATSLGRDPGVKPTMTPLSYGGPMICTLISVLASAVLLKALSVNAIGDAIIFGLIVGAGFLGATMTNVAINPNFPRPLTYARLNAPYFVLTGVLTSTILVAMA
jgi:hypothetical protein